MSAKPVKSADIAAGLRALRVRQGGRLFVPQFYGDEVSVYSLK